MPGFWMTGSDGEPIHVNGNPNMSAEDKAKILALMDALTDEYKRRQKSFNHLWEHAASESKKGVDKDIAQWWFDAGCDWPGRKAKK